MKHNRKTLTFPLEFNISTNSILQWIKQFSPVVFLNSNSSEQIQKDQYSSFNLLIATGSVLNLKQSVDFFKSMKDLHKEIQDWLVGYISFDVKNQTEKLYSSNPDGIKANDYFFFCPRHVFEFRENEIRVHYLPEMDDESSIEKLIDTLKNSEPIRKSVSKISKINQKVSREEYIDRVNGIKKHIRRGDIYEMNFCMEFFSEEAKIDPEFIYSELNSISPMPFSAFFRINEHSLMCASPERFISKRSNKIISQPIKGTAKRGMTEEEDKIIVEMLRNDPKEKAENVMIVDLVRNDLSKTAKRGSVKAEELFSVKTFRQLHQLVSTVTSELKDGLQFTDAIKNAFPMGSMTGAPKIRAMEIIEEFENTKRGLFSGTVGYITPEADFDFNVIIRSIFYNSDNGYLSFMAGSAITDGAVAEKEYDECMLKVMAMKRVLGF